MLAVRIIKLENRKLFCFRCETLNWFYSIPNLRFRNVIVISVIVVVVVVVVVVIIVVVQGLIQGCQHLEPAYFLIN